MCVDEISSADALTDIGSASVRGASDGGPTDFMATDSVERLLGGRVDSGISVIANAEFTAGLESCPLDEEL